MTDEQISETAKEKRLLIREICGMTPDEKQLLLVDLCGRLPYRPKVRYYYYSMGSVAINGYSDEGYLSYQNLEDFSIYPKYGLEKTRVYNILPYLRPMSSMTEDEKEYIKNVARFGLSDGIHYDDGVKYVPIYQETLDDQWKADGKLPPVLGDIYRFMLDHGYILLIDFFNSHHIDYRGLIPMGLALEATSDMYDIKS